MAIDISLLFAMLEQRNNPGLRGKPICITKRNRPDRVAACSLEALAAEIRPGMSIHEARLICPTVRRKVANPEQYTRVYTKLAREISAIAPGTDFSSLSPLYIPSQDPSADRQKILTSIFNTTGLNYPVELIKHPQSHDLTSLHSLPGSRRRAGNKSTGNRITLDPLVSSALLPGSTSHRELLDWLQILSIRTSALLQHYGTSTTQLSLQFKTTRGWHTANSDQLGYTYASCDIYAACRKAFLYAWSGELLTQLRIVPTVNPPAGAQIDMFARLSTPQIRY